MVKKQYMIGKWYRFSNPNYKRGSFAKFVRLSNDEEFWYFNEYISNGVYRTINGGNWYADQCREMLTDLTEIQQYLPEGHEDKIKIYELW